jgi:lipopolysaccharide heptosyltransferase II
LENDLGLTLPIQAVIFWTTGREACATLMTAMPPSVPQSSGELARSEVRSKRQRNSPLKLAAQFLVYFIFRGFEAVLCLLPLPAVFAFGRRCGQVAWLVAAPYRRLARRNLEIAFGREKSPVELDRLCRAHFERLGANLLSSVKIPRMREADIAARVELAGIDHLIRAAGEGRGFIYALSHMGNWELLSQLRAACPLVPPATLFQPLANPYLNAHVQRLRSRLGFRMFDRRDGFHAPARHLRDNGGLGVLVDQHAGDGGVWVPFFGRLASTTNLAALLSLRTGAPVVSLALVTTGRARWRITVGPPIAGTSHGTAALTANINRAVESAIRESPADWFWVHNRWKTPRPNFLLARYKRGVELPTGIEAGQLKPFEILIRAPNWLGDACMALPAVRAIKRGRPDARVTVLTPAKLTDFWLAVPEVDAVVKKDAAEKKNGVFAVRTKIRDSGVRYDAAVLLTNSPRSALELTGCGIPRVVGYRGRWRKWLVNQIVPEPEPGPPRHHRDHYLRIAAHLGAETEDPSLLAPLRPPALAVGGEPARLGLCAGAEFGPAKRWPLERFAAVARQLAGQSGAHWIIFGTASETMLGSSLASQLDGHATDLTGQTTIAQLMDELARCRFLLTNDTGTMHLAAALGIPVIAVFGSTEPSFTGPFGNRHRVVRHHVECSPCFHRECPLKVGRYRCLDEVSVEEVTQAVKQTLASFDH